METNGASRGYPRTHLKVDVSVLRRGGYGLNPLPQPHVPQFSLPVLLYYIKSKQKGKFGYEGTKIYVKSKADF
jgi:hypothetical protein